MSDVSMHYEGSDRFSAQDGTRPARFGGTGAAYRRCSAPDGGRARYEGRRAGAQPGRAVERARGAEPRLTAAARSPEARPLTLRELRDGARPADQERHRGGRLGHAALSRRCRRRGRAHRRDRPHPRRRRADDRRRRADRRARALSTATPIWTRRSPGTRSAAARAGTASPAS